MLNDSTGKGLKQGLPFLGNIDNLLSKEGLKALKALKAELERGNLTAAQTAAAFDFIIKRLAEAVKAIEAEEEARSKTYITINEAALILGKSRQALYQKIQRGTIPPGCVWRPNGGGSKKVMVLASRLSEFR